MTASIFASGSLVRVRGREWVVLPESTDRLLRLRPLGGTDAETTGILLDIEQPEPACFELPEISTDTLGDWQSCRLLRDAVRLGFRSSAGPFRSFAGIAVEPRPYQVVPLMMALKLDPVRLLIGDDVGVGKTIEACLIARELIDRREVQRLSILCPPHLADQWQAELRDKFHIAAELVLPSTAASLERRCVAGRSIFEMFPNTIVSTDFIKSPRRRDDFVRAAPELVIVDEAHTCAFDPNGRAARHQRHDLVRQLADAEDRHLVLVTATPHTGKEETFRSLLGLLDRGFLQLPDDLTGRANEPLRRRVAAHFVQRRRGDIRHFMQADTPFPERKEDEATYNLHADYRKLFDRVLAHTREAVLDDKLGQHKRRVRWWSMLALLRALASSPAAAAATLRTRAKAANSQNPEEADAAGRDSVLDTDDPEAEITDDTPGSDPGEPEGDQANADGRERRRLQEMARTADALHGKKDQKVAAAAHEVKKLVDDGFAPIVFCRFIATAEYITEQLRERLPKGVAIETVTGSLPPAERETRVEQLKTHDKRVLVCTDCLSEGINLQDRFTAVVHYDLSWSPTRHEQREGRVDRYGQKAPEIRALALWSKDTLIDGVVLDTLLRKHQKIRSSLGISVPVPRGTDQVIEAIFEGILLRRPTGDQQLMLPGLDQEKEQLHAEWEEAQAREEKRSMTMFAQQPIRADQVQAELEAAREGGGVGIDVRDFVVRAVEAHGGVAAPVADRDHAVKVDLGRVEVDTGLRDVMGEYAEFTAAFEYPAPDGQVYLHRTHPAVEALAGYTMNIALDPHTARWARAKRAGAIRTRDVDQLTTVLLVRTRYEITTTRRDRDPRSLMAEDCRVLAFTGLPDNPHWLDEQDARRLVEAERGPDANTLPQQAAGFLKHIVDGFDTLWPHLEQSARQHAEDLLDAHRRVRAAAQDRGVSYEIQSKLPPDVLGIYVYLPMGGTA